MSRLTQKLKLYAQEAKFILTATKSVRDALALGTATANFHYRNWRRSPIEPGALLKVDLDLNGTAVSLALRPRDGDLAILYEVLARRAYQLPDGLRPTKQELTIVDAGANIGLSSLYFASTYPNARIFSIEPNPENFALLKKNVAQFPNIKPIQACVTAEAGQQVFISTSGRASHFKMNNKRQGISVRGLSLDELCEDEQLDFIDFLKMDVEGAERKIFAAPTFLKRTGVIAAELHGRYDLNCFNRDLSPAGFCATISPCANDPALVIAHKT